MKHIVDTIGWERLRLGLAKTTPEEPVNVIMFIKKFKDLNLNERITYGEDESDFVNFSFSLPPKIADEFTTALLSHGMRMTNKSRTNMSSAMTKIIKELAEE